jgi:hypothetical protein
MYRIRLGSADINAAFEDWLEWDCTLQRNYSPEFPTQINAINFILANVIPETDYELTNTEDKSLQTISSDSIKRMQEHPNSLLKILESIPVYTILDGIA